MLSALFRAESFILKPYNVPYHDFMVLDAYTEFALQVHSLFSPTRR